MEPKDITATSIASFQETVWNYYKNNRRDMPWRVPGPNGTYDPYAIMVSELMLQQTQVSRVIPKYQLFLQEFPNLLSLAHASLEAVLRVWSGLGYSRRAKYLHGAAQRIVEHYQGVVPRNIEDLITLPGIGKNTAGAIVAYSFNQPAVFIETNIRTVFIHHFFGDAVAVRDADIADLVAQTLPKDAYREWYYALMDYGSSLKTTHGNKSRQARTYTQQTPFQGSLRQVRGAVLRALMNGPQNLSELHAALGDDRLPAVCQQLELEGLIHKDKNRYFLG